MKKLKVFLSVALLSCVSVSHARTQMVCLLDDSELTFSIKIYLNNNKILVNKVVHSSGYQMKGGFKNLKECNGVGQEKMQLVGKHSKKYFNFLHPFGHRKSDCVMHISIPRNEGVGRLWFSNLNSVQNVSEYATSVCKKI